MVPRKKAKANAVGLNSKRKAEEAAVPVQSEASASSVVKTEMGLLNNDEDVGEVGGYQNIGEEVTVGGEIANEQWSFTPKEEESKEEEEEEEEGEQEEEEEGGGEETGQSDEVGEEEDMVEEEEVVVESRENNARNEVEETCPVIEIDGQTADVIGDKKDVGEVSCEGVVVKEQQDEKVEKQEIIRSRKRIRKSTVMGRSAGKLDLKGVKEDLKEHNNGEDVVSDIDKDKSNVAHGNKDKHNVGVGVENSGKEVQIITEKDMGESSKKKRKILKQKNRSDPLVEGSLVKVASENGGKSGQSNKKKGTLKPGTKGMIFMCSSNTKTDCYRYMVLGLPAGKRDMVENISEGMVLFLYDVDQKLLNGIYKAAAHGGYNIEPEAFDSKFPAQVRFEILEGCLPLGEEKFREVIKENYFSRSKFDCQLNSEQVENLCNLFRASVDDVKHERHGRRSAQRPPKIVRGKLKAAPAPFKAESHKAMRPPGRKARRHHNRPLLRNEVAPLPRRPVKRPQSTFSIHAYERTSNREVLRGEPSEPHHEIYRHDTYGDPYLDPRRVYRQEQLLPPRDSYREEQPQLHSRDLYRPYPVLERRDYDLDPLPDRHDSCRRQGSLLDNQDLYRSDLVLEGQNRQRLNLEPRHSSSLLPREDRSPYGGGVYSTAHPLRASMVPESRAAGLPSVYLSYAEAEPRYYSHRPVYRL